MAVDVIARALAAKASSGGSGNKVPIDITGAMDEVLSAINTSYCPVRSMGFTFPENLAQSIGGQIAAAGKDNVDLFFKVGGTVPVHHAFAFEINGLYVYFFLLGTQQMLYDYVRPKGYPPQTSSFITVSYDPKTETMLDLSVFFISEDETPLYITGIENETFRDLESIKTILDYPGNQIIETDDYILANIINNLFKEVINIQVSGSDFVSRIEHYSDRIYLGYYSRFSKQWGYVASIYKYNKTIVDSLAIQNGTLYIDKWGSNSTLNGDFLIDFSNGVPSQIIFFTNEQIELTPNVPLLKQGFFDKSVPEVNLVLRNVLYRIKNDKIATTNFVAEEGGQVKNYYCTSNFSEDGVSLTFFSKDSLIIPAETPIVIKLS